MKRSTILMPILALSLAFSTSSFAREFNLSISNTTNDSFTVKKYASGALAELGTLAPNSNFTPFILTDNKQAAVLVNTNETLSKIYIANLDDKLTCTSTVSTYKCSIIPMTPPGVRVVISNQ